MTTSRQLSACRGARRGRSPPRRARAARPRACTAPPAGPDRSAGCGRWQPCLCRGRVYGRSVSFPDLATGYALAARSPQDLDPAGPRAALAVRRGGDLPARSVGVPLLHLLDAARAPRREPAADRAGAAAPGAGAERAHGRDRRGQDRARARARSAARRPRARGIVRPGAGEAYVEGSLRPARGAARAARRACQRRQPRRSCSPAASAPTGARART